MYEINRYWILCLMQMCSSSHLFMTQTWLKSWLQSDHNKIKRIKEKLNMNRITEFMNKFLVSEINESDLYKLNIWLFETKSLVLKKKSFSLCEISITVAVFSMKNLKKFNIKLTMISQREFIIFIGSIKGKKLFHT